MTGPDPLAGIDFGLLAPFIAPCFGRFGAGDACGVSSPSIMESNPGSVAAVRSLGRLLMGGASAGAAAVVARA